MGVRTERVDRTGPIARVRPASPHIGGKAQGIAFLARHGFAVPMTYAIPWDVQPAAGSDAGMVARECTRELCRHASLCSRPLAVRSSANIEDDPEHSFAGQFESLLDVEGEEALAEAIEAVWTHARSERVRSYAELAGVDPQSIRTAIIVQEQVAAVVSGVAFGKNPLTGLDEVIVEAVRGSGEQLGRAGVTPSRWTWKWGEYTDEVDPADIGRAIIDEVVSGTSDIQKAYGAPVDVEWCWDGSRLWWVQVREITALRTATIYSNRISREVLPGLIRPAVWSINTRLVNGAWVALITEIIGPNDIEPRSLSRTFYYRAYFDMGTFGQIFDAFGMPRESLEILMGMEGGSEERPSLRPTLRGMRHLPRLLRFASQKLRYGPKIEAFLERGQTRYDSFGAEDAEGRTDEALVERVQELFEIDHEAAYFNIITPLLAQFYSRMFTRRLEAAGVDPGEFDMRAGVEEFDDVDPARGLAALKSAYDRAPLSVRLLADAGEYDALVAEPGAEELTYELGAYLERYGHLSDSGNDFSAHPWSERPGDVLKNIAAHGHSAPSKRMSWDDVVGSGVAGQRLARARDKAMRFEHYREAVGSTFTRAYGLFRPYILEIGRRLVARGILADAEDVFFLYDDEAADVLLGRSAIDVASTVGDRKAEFVRAAELIPPETVFGDDPEPLEPGDFAELRGTPTSRGHHRGRAVQVKGLADGDRLREGDVLFVPFTDVAWTPLFARAGAVVAESGGFLSHSSIVARERGIPAVVSVSGATQVPEGTQVIVDGYAGTVTIESEEPAAGS